MNDKRESEARELTRQLWHDSSGASCLGCSVCNDLRMCGGLSIDGGAHDCLSFCRCKDVEKCHLVCRHNPKQFVARVREVKGFPLDNLPRHRQLQMPSIPLVAPLIEHKSRRQSPLRSPAAAVHLKRCFSHRSGRLLFDSRKTLRDRFCIDSPLIIVSGVSKDQPIEHYWSKARAMDCARFLVQAGVDLVTTPNFSLFSDVPRWDNFYNMKRIAICWEEFAAVGLPAALHLNARTDRDYERWIDFLISHPEISALAFEFQTGPGHPTRAAWHVEKLHLVQQSVGRRFRLVCHGGLLYLPVLQGSFDVTLISSQPFQKTIHRRRLAQRPGGQMHWEPVLTLKDQLLDELLQLNVERFSDAVQRGFSENGTTSRRVVLNSTHSRAALPMENSSASNFSSLENKVAESLSGRGVHGGS